MKTKIQITHKTYAELRISGITLAEGQEDVKLALETLEDFMSSFPIDIGYNFENTPDPNSLSGIPSAANNAIQLALAMQLCAAFGKDSSMLQARATAAMSQLYAVMFTPGRVSYPTRQPLGMGNRGRYPCFKFMPPISQAPKSINTETFTLDDKKVFSIDFSEYLAANESIQSYTATPDSGLTVTSASFSGSILTFTVRADDSGYQSIKLVANGDAGSIVNRKLDFNVLESSSIRGNP